MAAESKAIKFIEVSVWLGSNRRVVIRADDRVSVSPSSSAIRFRRSGQGASAADLVKVLTEVLDKLRDAYPKPAKTEITLSVDGTKIVPTN